MLRMLTAGESHGKALLGILEGMPAGLKIKKEKINQELLRRRRGVGRGARMKIEKDKIEIISGLRAGKTLGSPIGVLIENKDNKIFCFNADNLPQLLCPRPGHVDLAGCKKYGFEDLRNAWERSSARETAMRVALGAICKIFLEEFRIKINSKVIMVKNETSKQRINAAIKQAAKDRDTVGGVFELKINSVPAGLGSYVHYDRRLDARLAFAIMSIPGIKAVEFGLGFAYAKMNGSKAHDVLYYNKKQGFFHKTNNAGGIEGGVTNGEPIIIKACMKPISTLGKPLDSVNLRDKKPSKAEVLRSDVCVVEAASVIAEAVLSLEISNAFLEKFGGDNLKEIKGNYLNYLKELNNS